MALLLIADIPIEDITIIIIAQKHLYNIYTTSAQRLQRWANIVQMLYKCFGFTGGFSHKHTQSALVRVRDDENLVNTTPSKIAVIVQE